LLKGNWIFRGLGWEGVVDLVAGRSEKNDLAAAQPAVAARLKAQLLAWNASSDASCAGRDYPEGKVSPPDPESEYWFDTPQYQPSLAEWKTRWEYQNYLDRAASKKGGKKKQAAK
jgi:hypothetical protein